RGHAPRGGRRGGRPLDGGGKPGAGGQREPSGRGQKLRRQQRQPPHGRADSVGSNDRCGRLQPLRQQTMQPRLPPAKLLSLLTSMTAHLRVIPLPIRKLWPLNMLSTGQKLSPPK
ncbi:unnamed protein product, partial [Phaeothamnion confervicola]